MILAVKNLEKSLHTSFFGGAGERFERKQKMWSLKWARQGNTGMGKVILILKKCPNTVGNANKITLAS